ncbi:MAG TPA: GLPGLI family protein [Flavisolibacter sp.]|nr:GLPGLI family protein [Flavisolibacter sp.]
MKKIVVIALLLFAGAQVKAQTLFHNSVKIEFEKVVYSRQLYKELSPEWFDMIKDRLPNETTSYFDFIGDTTHSIFKPGREIPVDSRAINMSIADKNVVYNDYKTGLTVTQKPVFEETFLMQDSLLKIKWKLTSDTRNIAGFECRKAVGIIDDSIAVFAFYTDEILVNGGPEGAHGLPGMILGLGMPRIHTTWFATKVEVNGVNLSTVVPATKGKKVNRQTMIQSLDKVLKNWGNYGKNMVLNFII